MCLVIVLPMSLAAFVTYVPDRYMFLQDSAVSAFSCSM